MEEIAIDKAIESAGKEAQSLLDKFFAKIASSEKNNELAKPFPNGIGYIKVSVKVTANISLDFIAADINYKIPTEKETMGAASSEETVVSK